MTNTEAIETLMANYPDACFEQLREAVDAAIEALKVQDTIEVVQCKDCKWWKTKYSWNGNERKICVREAYEPFRKAEDFCSRGERREDE